MSYRDTIIHILDQYIEHDLSKIIFRFTNQIPCGIVEKILSPYDKYYANFGMFCDSNGANVLIYDGEDKIKTVEHKKEYFGDNIISITNFLRIFNFPIFLDASS